MSDQGQAPAASDTSIEERVTNALFPPKQEKVEEPEEEKEQVEATEETEQPEEESETEAEKEEVEEKPEEAEELEWDKVKDLKLEITVQGEKAEVTLEEARLGYMRTSDYQKKTQELSQQRKQVVDEASKVVEQVQENYVNELKTLEQAVQELAMQELAKVDLNWLAETDPNAYIKYQHRANQFGQVLQKLQAEQKKVSEENSKQTQTKRAQMLEQGMLELKERIPNFDKEVEQQLIKAGKEYGFKQEELESIIDPRVLHVLNDARQFRELSASKPQTLKKAAVAPKVIKPGAKPAIKQDNKGQELKQRIMKSGGKDDDALTAFIKRTMR